MRACIMRGGTLVVDEVPTPEPAFGQVLVRTLACGICGSDLHFLHHAETMVALTEDLRDSMGPMAQGAPRIDLGRDIIMGHEFCAEVVGHGPDTVAPPEGSLVVSVPVMLTMQGVQQLAYNNELPGGFAEYMLLSAPLVVPVPDGLDPGRAALTEPLAVGIHAVAESGIAPGQAAVVAGCGPVGLAVIAALGLAGVEPIVAADYSAARRGLARALGATEVVDPSGEPLLEAWRRVDGRLPLVAFEAVGRPGILDQLLRDVPPRAQVVSVGACMEPDTFRPFYATCKEVALRFVVAYNPAEFNKALVAIAEGAVDVAPLISGTVDLDGVPGAFEALAHPDELVKVLVEPTPR